MSPVGQPEPQHSVSVNKYTSLDSLERSKKVDALKNPRLVPGSIKDPYDELAHNYHLWKTVAAKAQAQGYSQEQKDVLAMHFHTKMLAPAYARAGMEPTLTEDWVRHAYGQALSYKLEDAYDNNIIHALKHGAFEGKAAMARAEASITDLIGNTMNTAVELYKARANERAQFAQQLKTGQKPADAFHQDNSKLSWHEYLSKTVSTGRQQIQAQKKELAAIPHVTSAYAEDARRNSQSYQFWADAHPTYKGALNTVTSMVAEQVIQAPLYAILNEGAGISGARNLTEKLMTSSAGKRAMGYLLAGTEGLAYGTAVRKQEDPGEGLRDALGFMVFHGVFDVAGAGLKSLRDIAPESWKAKLDHRAETLDLGQKGMRRATPVEEYSDHKTQVANNLAVGGPVVQNEIHAQALQHVHDIQEEGMTSQQIREHEKRLLDEDPAQWAPVLSAAKFIRSLLGDKKMSEIELGSEDEKFITSRLSQLTTEAGTEMNTRVQGMSDVREVASKENLQQPSAQHTLEYYQAKAEKMLSEAPGASKLVTPEQVKKYAEKLYADDLGKAAEKSEKVIAGGETEKAKNAGARRKDAPATKIRSERKVSGKDVSVRYSVTPDYTVRLTAHTKAAKASGKELSEYFRALSDEDFKDDLNDYFYPRELGKAGVFFENQHTREGVQNPNFLAFMYNYKAQMPEEFQAALTKRLVDTVKVQQNLKGRNLTEPQLMYYAKSMWNHVDNFLASGRWLGESNIFRSSNENIWNSTEWQRQLLVERTLQEQKNLKEMFSGDAEGTKLALLTHGKLARERMIEFDKASQKRKSQDKIRELSRQIDEMQQGLEGWNF